MWLHVHMTASNIFGANARRVASCWCFHVHTCQHVVLVCALGNTMCTLGNTASMRTLANTLLAVSELQCRP